MSSNDVVQMSDLDHVRLRPGMYVGGVAENDNEANPESLRTCFREVTDNSIDEFIAGHGNNLWVFVDKKATEPLGTETYNDKSNKFCKKWYRYTCADDGRGIPIKPVIDNKGRTVTMMELAMSSLRAGSKFSKTSEQIGTNGVGQSCNTFLSAESISYTHLKCHSLTDTTDEVKDLIKKAKVTKATSEGKYLKIVWHLGVRHSIEIVDKKDDPILSKYFEKELPSTVTSWIPDPTIHRSTVMEVKPTFFKYVGYIYPNLKFFIDGKKVNTKIGYKNKDAIEIELPKEDTEVAPKNPWIKIDYSIEMSKDFNKYSHDFSVNTLDCQAGKHLRMFEAAWAQAFCDYFGNHDIEKYASMGLNVLFILRCPEPSFSSQTKERLTTVEGWESSAPLPKLVKSFTKIIKADEETFKTAFDRIVEFYSAKQAVGKLKELKKQLGDMTSGKNRSASAFLPKKLLDCPCKDRSTAEVFFVEGDSAAGGFVKARSGMDNIAIMPLRGKVLNVVGMDTAKALENNEIYDITNICGGVDEMHLELDKLHYGQFNIATDSDSDGLQIGALLLGDLMQNHRFLFGTADNKYQDSKVFVIVAPLYAFEGVDGKKGNSKYFYAGEESDVAAFRKAHKFKTFKRFKGLGELNSDELREMYLDPKKRRQVQIRPDNIEAALGIIGGAKEKKDLMISEKVITLDVVELENE